MSFKWLNDLNTLFELESGDSVNCVILQEKIDTFTIYDADKHISCLSSYHKTVYTQFNYFCELL